MPHLKSGFRRIAAIWDEFWFSPFDPLPAGLFRISLGALIFALFIFLYPHWESFYASNGFTSLDILDPHGATQDWWCLFYWTEGIIPIKAFWWIGLFSAAAFTLGWRTRLFTVILYVLQTSMIHRDISVVNGEDLILRMLLFYSCFAPLGSSLSVDAWLAGKSRKPPVWAIRLIQINVAIIYVISVPYKLTYDAAWRTGDAMYWVLVNATWSRWLWPDFLYSGSGRLLVKLMTYGSLLVEGMFPILVWFETPKLLVIAALAGLHIGIAAFLQNVTFFTLQIACALWLYVPAPTLRRGRDWLEGVLLRLAPRRAAL